MKITYFDEDTIVVMLKDGSGAHLSETCLKKVYLDGKVQNYHYDDLDKVNAFLNKLKNYDREKLYELKDEAFYLLFFIGIPNGSSKAFTDNRTNENLNEEIEKLKAENALIIKEADKSNIALTQQLITWRNDYRALEDHTIMVESKLRCWQEEFKSDTPWEAKSKFYADHAIAQSYLENRITEYKIKVLTHNLDSKVKDLKNQLDLSNLDRQSWKDAYHRVEDFRIKEKQRLKDYLDDCYNLCESCQSRKEGSDKPVQAHLDEILEKKEKGDN